MLVLELDINLMSYLRQRGTSQMATGDILAIEFASLAVGIPNEASLIET